MNDGRVTFLFGVSLHASLTALTEIRDVLQDSHFVLFSLESFMIIHPFILLQGQGKLFRTDARWGKLADLSGGYSGYWLASLAIKQLSFGLQPATEQANFNPYSASPGYRKIGSTHWLVL